MRINCVAQVYVTDEWVLRVVLVTCEPNFCSLPSCIALITTATHRTDQFAITTDYGAIYRVSIGHDNSGIGASWNMQKVSTLRLVLNFSPHCLQLLGDLVSMLHRH